MGLACVCVCVCVRERERLVVYRKMLTFGFFWCVVVNLSSVCLAIHYFVHLVIHHLVCLAISPLSVWSFITYPFGCLSVVVPVYGSKPHFLDGDPSLTKNVIGMHPVRSKHDTVVDVEPVSNAHS